MVKNTRCPTCQNAASYSAQNPYRPFCSERCKLIDLGAWAKEEYKIPDPTTTPINPDEESDDLEK